jgi:hypothetical protein
MSCPSIVGYRQFPAFRLRPTPKSLGSFTVVSVRSARPSLKYYRLTVECL